MVILTIMVFISRSFFINSVFEYDESHGGSQQLCTNSTFEADARWINVGPPSIDKIRVQKVLFERMQTRFMDSCLSKLQFL